MELTPAHLFIQLVCRCTCMRVYIARNHCFYKTFGTVALYSSFNNLCEYILIMKQQYITSNFFCIRYRVVYHAIERSDCVKLTCLRRRGRALTPSILNVIGIGTARFFFAFKENSQGKDQQIDKNKCQFISCEYRKA